MIALLIAVASAAEVTWSFEAQATSNLDAAYSGVITPGDLLVGTVTFDEPAGTGGTYQDVVVAADFTLLGQSWSMLSGGSATVNNGATDSFSTAWTFQGPNLTGAGGQAMTPTAVNVAVFDTDGTVFDSRAFPSPPPSIAQLETKDLVLRFADTVNGGQPSAVFEITAWEELPGQDFCPDSPKAQPLVCGCSHEDVAVVGGTACVHYEATVSAGATLADGVRIDAGAVVGASSIGADTVVAQYATVGDGSSIGPSGILSRRSIVEDNVVLGPDATLQRSTLVQSDTVAGTDFTLGFGSSVGPGADIGDRFIGGSLVDLDALISGDDVIVARGAVFTGTVTLNHSVVIGPDVAIGDGSVLQTGVRVRKDTVLGQRVTVGQGSRLGRDCRLGDDSGLGDNVTLGALVTLGTFAHLQDNERAPRNTDYPDDYDHDDDGALSLAMGGNDCNDFDAGSIEVCIVDVANVGGVREWSDGSYAASCDDYRNPVGVPVYSGDTGSGQYNIDPDGDGTPFVAYCDMSSAIGWTLAANIAPGSGSNWTYDSTWWTVSGSAQQSDPGPGQGEARYEPFDASPYTAIRIVDTGNGNEVHLSDSDTSLVQRFASTSSPVLSDQGNGGHSPSGRATLTLTRYDAGSFPYFSQFNALSICSSSQANDVTGWTTTTGVAINERGRYDASNGSVAQGRARIGAWFGGSNSHIWSQTADCAFGLGAQTQRDGSITHTGTSMASVATLWVR